MHCEQCHRPLAHAHEICKSCNVELSYPIRTSSGYVDRVSRYKCPACDGSFERWTNELRPANARWYVPQRTKTVCPMCAVELRWKRSPEPAQLPEELQSIALASVFALWNTIPQALNQSTGTRLLTLLALISIFVLAVRPPLLSVGQGAGHFVLASNTDSSRTKMAAVGLSIGSLMVFGYWATPQAHKPTVWAAGFGLAVLGCLLAVVWRMRTEKGLHRSAA